MTLGDMRELGVQRLIASCLNDACRHQGLVDVSGYPADTEVPWFRSRVKCAKYGGRGKDRRQAQLERAAAATEPSRQGMALMPRWRVEIIKSNGKRFEQLGTVEAPEQREAYRLAIEKFDVPIERQSRLFVIKSDEKA
jgi:hypothetical protein